MTRIVINELLPPTTRTISNVKSLFTTSDGPNLSSIIDLIDLGIPYDSHYRSRIVLPAGSEDYFLNYGLLQNVTFLLMKVTYNGNYDFPKEDDFDPNYRYEKENYNITYYYEGNSGLTYPIGRLLLLNGSLTHKLTKIYLNNPLDYDVVLDVLHANINPPKPTPTSSAITISNLYYNDITTNTGICSSNSGFTGSTLFIINKIVPAIPSGYTIDEYYVSYDTILNFNRDLIYPMIFLYTTTNTIFLKFLTQFDCDQAYSRMIFAYNSYLNDTCRYLTDSNVYQNNSAINCLSGSSYSGHTGVDTMPPVITYNSAPSGSTWIGSGSTIPTNVRLHLAHDGITGWTITQLKYLFISGVTDCWDGIIPISAVTLKLYEKGSIIELSNGITEEGLYDVVISCTDNAGNTTINYIII